MAPAGPSRVLLERTGIAAADLIRLPAIYRQVLKSEDLQPMIQQFREWDLMDDGTVSKADFKKALLMRVGRGGDSDKVKAELDAPFAQARVKGFTGFDVVWSTFDRGPAHGARVRTQRTDLWAKLNKGDGMVSIAKIERAMQEQQVLLGETEALIARLEAEAQRLEAVRDAQIGRATGRVYSPEMRSALYESLASSRMHWQPPHQRFGPPLLPPEFPCKDHTPLVSGAIANDVASAAGSRAPTPAAVARAATPLLGRAATPLAPLRRARSDAGLRRARTPDSRPRSQRSQLGSRPGSQPGAPLCGSASVTSMRSIRGTGVCSGSALTWTSLDTSKPALPRPAGWRATALHRGAASAADVTPRAAAAAAALRAYPSAFRGGRYLAPGCRHEDPAQLPPPQLEPGGVQVLRPPSQRGAVARFAVSGAEAATMQDFGEVVLRRLARPAAAC
eukprot:Transcript_957.p1 GENE.Transcript_957~~Transcript_957.p1  ORF type:complete len:487 (-),score=134.10 Transcript_957:104-1447(-)